MMMMFLGLRKLGNICCGHNVSGQHQKPFLCPGHKNWHKICVRNKCCARGQTGKLLCRQQCVHNNVSATMCPRLPGPFKFLIGVCFIFSRKWYNRPVGSELESLEKQRGMCRCIIFKGLSSDYRIHQWLNLVLKPLQPIVCNPQEQMWNLKPSLNRLLCNLSHSSFENLCDIGSKNLRMKQCPLFLRLDYGHPLSSWVHLLRSKTKRPEDQSKVAHYHQHVCCFL